MIPWKQIGLFAFIATGFSLIITAAVRQTSPWFFLLAVIAAGYLFGLINHYHGLRS